MDAKVILLHELPLDVATYLQACLDAGEPLLVVMPDHRLVAIQPLDERQTLIDYLIADNLQFQALLAKSASSGSKPFRFAPTTSDE